MTKSASLRAEDWRAILRLAHECRDLGADRDGWRLHFIAQLARLVEADLGHCGEMGGHRAMKQRSLGVTHWGHENWAKPADFRALQDRIERDPRLYGSILVYFQRLVREDGICHSRRELIDDRDWYNSTDYQMIHRSYGMDHVLWCFRSLAGAGDEFSGLMLVRAIGRRDFGARDRLIVREAHAAVAPLIGGPLARFTEPSPRDLTPRVRQVLGHLLEGDSDKHIAARLKLSAFTVNQYTKAIFRQFGVRSRPELLARWIRRGWHARPPRAD